MAIRRFSTASVNTGVKSNKMWDQDTAQGAMVPIVSYTFTADGNNPNFTNIPQDYQDIRIVVNSRGADTAGTSVLFSIYVNGFGSAFASRTTIQGQGTTVTSYRHSTSTPTYGMQFYEAGGTAPNGVFSMATADILDYTNTNKFKTYLTKIHSNTSTAGIMELTATTYASTAAVTSFQVSGTGNFKAGSTVTIYGIKAGA